MSSPEQHLRVDEVGAYLAARAAGGEPMPVLLDVREAWELQTAALQLPGVRSVHIPMGSLAARLSELDPAQPILALCHHGMRSMQCVAFLQRQGLNAINIAGGIDAWSQVVDPSIARY